MVRLPPAEKLSLALRKNGKETLSLHSRFCSLLSSSYNGILT